jgi:hypothetical protein
MGLFASSPGHIYLNHKLHGESLLAQFEDHITQYSFCFGLAAGMPSYVGKCADVSISLIFMIVFLLNYKSYTSTKVQKNNKTLLLPLSAAPPYTSLWPPRPKSGVSGLCVQRRFASPQSMGGLSCDAIKGWQKAKNVGRCMEPMVAQLWFNFAKKKPFKVLCCIFR